jgi:hypothetical protein
MCHLDKINFTYIPVILYNIVMTNKSWNTDIAKQVFAKFTKIAEDMLEQATAAPPSDAAGSAGPQEVVDALEGVVAELESISQAIPAESSAGPEELGAPTVEAPVEEPNPEEEDPKFAKLQKQMAAQQVIIDRNELEKVAKTYAELHVEPKVQQAKYDEVLSSSEQSSVWLAKIEAIEQFKQEQGINSYKPAQTTSNWLKPLTKVAKQGNGRMRL